MVEIIRPKFERKTHHKLRLLRAKPSLADHPEYKGVKPPSVKPVAFIAAVTMLLMAVIRRRR